MRHPRAGGDPFWQNSLELTLHVIDISVDIKANSSLLSMDPACAGTTYLDQLILLCTLRKSYIYKLDIQSSFIPLKPLL